MNRRALLVTAAVLAAVTAPHATAAVKKPKPLPPVCNLIKDDAGDARGVNGPNDSLDVLTADVASGAKSVTAVIRVKAAPSADDQNTAMGKLYTLSFTAGKDVTVNLQAKLTKLGGAKFSSNTGAASFKAGTATGSFTGTEIRITANPAELPAANLKAGTVFSALKVADAYMLSSSSGIPEMEDSITGSSPSDSADGGKATYTAGAKSCVTP